MFGEGETEPGDAAREVGAEAVGGLLVAGPLGVESAFAEEAYEGGHGDSPVVASVFGVGAGGVDLAVAHRRRW